LWNNDTKITENIFVGLNYGNFSKMPFSKLNLVRIDKNLEKTFFPPIKLLKNTCFPYLFPKQLIVHEDGKRFQQDGLSLKYYDEKGSKTMLTNFCSFSKTPTQLKKEINQMTYFLHNNKVSLIHQSVFHAFIKLKPLPQKMNTIEQIY
jgi:hypothetical protein